MATNVMFKRGSQAALANVTPQDGVFYLTEDTNRLYVGQRSSTAANAEIRLVELNKSITNVSQIQSDGQGGYTVTEPTGGIRPVTPGEFYYYGGTTASPANILMIGQEGGKLLQINADTDIHVCDGSLAFSTPAGGTAINLTTKIYNSSANGASQTATAVVDKTVSFAAGNNITMSATNSVLTINADNSVLSATTASAAGIDLSVDGTTAINVYGDGGTVVALDANGKIKISSGDTSGFTYTLSGYTDGASVSSNTASNSKGRRQVHLANGSGSSTSDVYLPIPQIKLDAGTTSTYNASVDANGYDVITLPVYTKTEVDSKFSTITSAMSYRGAATAIPSTGGSGASGALVTGDMWKATTAISSTGVSAKTGDLIIYNGSGWDVVPSGDDQSISATVNSNKLMFSDSLASSTTGNLATIGYNNTQDSTTATVQFSSSGSLGKDYILSATLPVYHSTTPSAVTATSGTATYGSSVTIPSLAVDKYGRVTSVTASSLTLPAAQTISGNVDTPANGDEDPYFSVSLTDGGTATFYTKTLTVSRTGTTGNEKHYIDITWGEF